MLTSLLRFEIRFQVKQVSVLLFAVLALAYGISITASEMGEGMQLLTLNAPYRINFFVAVTSVLGLFVTMILSVNSGLRDREHNFDGITGILSLKQQYMSRFMVTLVCSLIIITGIGAGLFLGLFSFGLDSDRVSSPQFAHYFWPWLIFVVPNVFIMTSLLFLTTVKFGKAIFTYALAVGLFLYFWITIGLSNAPLLGPSIMANAGLVSFVALIEPFGVIAFFEQTQFWTAPIKNQQTISFSGSLMMNRLIWVGIAGLLLGLLKYTVHEATKTARKKHSSGKPVLDSPAAAKFTWLTQDTTTLAYQLSSFTGLLRRETSLITSGWGFRIILTLWSAAVIFGIYMATTGFSGGEVSSRLPTTALIFGYTGELIPPFCTLFLVYYVAEKISQERLVKIDGLINVTPVSNLHTYLSKLLSLMVLPIAMISVIIVVGMSYQALYGYYHFEIGHYLSMLYYFGLPLFIKTVSLYFIQSAVAKSRFANIYVGIVISGLLLLLLSNLGSISQINIPMLNIGYFPSLVRAHTELAGYGVTADEFHWYAGLWSMLFLPLALYTVTASSRITGTDTNNSSTDWKASDHD